MCKYCDGWVESGLTKRDFQHSKDGPEEITRHPKRKSKRWCKNKEGREHDYERVVWHTRRYMIGGEWIVEDVRRWACKNCGKVSWGQPKPPVEKHEHCYCQTHIRDWSWKNSEEIFEFCCVCGGKGRSYKFYK